VRYYSIIDSFTESGTASVEIDNHTADKTLGADWTQIPILLTDEAVINPAKNAVEFTSTETGGSIALSTTGFDNLIRLRTTCELSQDASSDGQYQKFYIIDGTFSGYVLTLLTTTSNTVLSYKLQSLASSVASNITGMSGTVALPSGKFNVNLSITPTTVSLQLASETALTATVSETSYSYEGLLFMGQEPADTGGATLNYIEFLGDATDPEYTEEYTRLLIRQYYEKTKAKAEISHEANQFSKVYTVMRALYDLDPFDVDTAQGVFLNIIGKIVFGYDARASITGTSLTDEEYRFFIKLKIAKNTASAFMVSDDYVTIQDVIQQAFTGAAFVTDSRDMALNLYIDETVDTAFLSTVDALDLLPSGMGVRYRSYNQYTVDGTFGFEDNPQALTWDDKFASVDNPGKFAEKIIV
jgi:hypothetical protein